MNKKWYKNYNNYLVKNNKNTILKTLNSNNSFNNIKISFRCYIYYLKKNV